MTDETTNIFDLIKNNLEKNGIREEDTEEYFYEHYGAGQIIIDGIEVPYRTEEEMINYKFRMPYERELERIYIKKVVEEDIGGIDKEKLSEVLIDCYNKRISYKECEKIV